jgi:hypothetical protein
MSDTQTEISELKQSVALLTELLARGADRAEREAMGTTHKSPALLAHEALIANVALAEHAPKTPPENADEYVTITLKRMHHSERDPDWNQAWIGVTFHDAASDSYVVCDVSCEIPTFLPKRAWSGSFPREAADLGRLMQKGIVSVKPGVVIESKAVAVEYGQAVATAYIHADPARAKITEDDLLRVAKLVDSLEPKLARDLRSLAAGVAVDPKSFGLTGGEADNDADFYS